MFFKPFLLKVFAFVLRIIVQNVSNVFPCWLFQTLFILITLKCRAILAKFATDRFCILEKLMFAFPLGNSIYSFIRHIATLLHAHCQYLRCSINLLKHSRGKSDVWWLFSFLISATICTNLVKRKYLNSVEVEQKWAKMYLDVF